MNTYKQQKHGAKTSTHYLGQQSSVFTSVSLHQGFTSTVGQSSSVLHVQIILVNRQAFGSSKATEASDHSLRAL
jgi:hypothetical protein